MNIISPFFKKILKQKEEKETLSIQKLGDHLENADLDYKFAQLFTCSGGFFSYCATQDEVLEVTKSIVQSQNINLIFCYDKELKKVLERLSFKSTEELKSICDSAFITCEYLIAFDGRIMLSEENIKYFTPSVLPRKLIIIAKVSQIVKNLNEAMMKIKRRGTVKSLTSISGDKSKFKSIDKRDKGDTKLFLLLLEDYMI